ncbi:hypothetical protein V6O07_23560, partial [Arthrospira platensis SPKY2]
FNFDWIPSNQYPDSYRGTTFEFKYDVATDYGFNFSNVVNNDTRWFKWNELPLIRMPSLSFGYDSTPGNNINRINDRWGEKVTTYVECIDPDQKNLGYSLNYNNKDTAVTSFSNIGVNQVNHNTTISAADYDNEYKSINNVYLYPINLDLNIISRAQCRDIFSMPSPVVESTGFKLLSTERRSNFAYLACDGSSKIGDTVYGLNIILQFNLSIPNSAKFTSANYRRRHYVFAREIGTNGGSWVMSTEEYPNKTTTEAWYKGTDAPDVIKLRVSISNNNFFIPGKMYEFKINTSVQTGDDSTMLYENSSDFFGKFMYGTYPDKATLIYPNSTQQPMRNPPLIITIPNQSNAANND